MKTKVFLCEYHNPWFNLATEDTLFSTADKDTQVLFLWQNSPSVIIGRAQNPWLECQIDKMQKEGILLARRQSGGGAVFHDLGNTNFTLISPKKAYNLDNNFNLILKALSQFGIIAHRSGRNDILVREKKVSGSAFRETKTHSFHHGTLLIDTNLSQLSHYLAPSKKKLEAKGIKSVRSRVINLKELNPEMSHHSICDTLIQHFFEKYGEGPILSLNQNTLAQNPQLNLKYQEYQSWEWRFGRTLSFTHQMEQQFSWGLVTIHFVVKKGIIKDVELYTDSLKPETLDVVCLKLKGIRYEKSDIIDACKGLEPLELIKWISNEVGTST